MVFPCVSFPQLNTHTHTSTTLDPGPLESGGFCIAFRARRCSVTPEVLQRPRRFLLMHGRGLAEVSAELRKREHTTLIEIFEVDSPVDCG